MDTRPLKEFADNLWTVQKPYKVLGMELGVRMTILRLKNGGLFVHSPIRLDSDLKTATDALGPVRFIVGPNLFHHLSLRPWAQAYPKAQLWGAPGLPEKRNNLKFSGQLSERAPDEWEAELRQIVVQGMPKLNEVVFLHPKTKTLILTDLAFHIREDSPFWTRFLFRFVNGSYGRMAPTRLFKTVLKDKKAFRASLDKILTWDFDKIILSHGHMIFEEGKEVFRKAFEGIG